MAPSPAPTRRTAARKAPAAKKAASTVVDFDKERARIIKGRKNKSVFEWKCYDQVWHAKRPNVAFVAEQEDKETIGSFIATLLAHIVEPEREAFMAALGADEDLDFDVLGAMVADMQRVVYADVE